MAVEDMTVTLTKSEWVELLKDDTAGRGMREATFEKIAMQLAAQTKPKEPVPLIGALS